MSQLFPEEIVQFSAEAHFCKNNVRGQPVYIALIVLVLGLFVALPLVRIDLTYSARGILRTTDEASRIIAPREGKVEFNSMKLNMFVEQGDTLLILNHSSINNEIADTQKAIDLIGKYISDLRILLSGGGSPETERYFQAFMEYTHEMSRLNNEYNYAEDEFLSTKKLYENGFIARLDYESTHRRYISSKSVREVRKKEFQNRWQSELSNYELEFLQLNTRRSHLLISAEMNIIKAPISGYIIDYAEIKIGAYLSQKDMIARIVPNQELVASCMVTPDKISRISLGQSIKLNIDAYPGSSYGRINGFVSYVPPDASLFSGSPGFPIICEIQQEFKNSKSGTSAQLKSGMTFTGLFILSRKTLWQLIIEKGERLLYPTTSQEKNEAIIKKT